MKKLLNIIPIPMSGLMLGLASAGNLVASYGAAYKNAFGIVSGIILILLVLKIVLNFKGVAKALEDPVIASVSPTFSMGIMILSTYIKPYSPSAALCMWIVGLGLHLLLAAIYTLGFIFKFEIKKVFPSIFIVFVGTAAASVTAPAFGVKPVGEFFFWFGLVTYIILLPVVLYRVFKVKSIPEPAKPLLTIFAAPASLLLAGYMNSFDKKNMTLVWLLLILSLVMLLAVLLYMPSMLKLKFYPSYSAFTFPLVISATAAKLTNGFLVKTNHAVPMLKYVARFEEIIAVVIVIYVLIIYLMFIYGSLSVKENEQSSIAAK